jgi:hypothetical protein
VWLGFALDATGIASRIHRRHRSDRPRGVGILSTAWMSETTSAAW